MHPPHRQHVPPATLWLLSGRRPTSPGRGADATAAHEDSAPACSINSAAPIQHARRAAVLRLQTRCRRDVFAPPSPVAHLALTCGRRGCGMAGDEEDVPLLPSRDDAAPHGKPAHAPRLPQANLDVFFSRVYR
eukprot:350593-Chlamydomonas_euryale.AAC.10